MRKHQSAAVPAGIGIIFLLTFVPTSAERNRLPAFEPLFAGGASCTSVRPGRPVLLARMPALALL
jgi:hypothetical protein